MHQPSLLRWPRVAVVGGAAVLLALTGCEEGSISDTNLYPQPALVGRSTREIDELDLLGSHQGTSEGDIQDALRHGVGSGNAAYARPGDTLLVVQSGATAPDSIMVAALEKTYRVFPCSGVAANDRHRDGSLGRDLRLAAAKSGCQAVLCYWGKLESVREDVPTKTVSWVPIAGSLIPDEERTTRLRVRAVLIDVRSGRATTFAPPASQNSALSAPITRDGSHDRQIYDLKTRAYTGLAAQLSGWAL